jgi:hypothetical protein
MLPNSFDSQQEFSGGASGPLFADCAGIDADRNLEVLLQFLCERQILTRVKLEHSLFGEEPEQIGE